MLKIESYKKGIILSTVFNVFNKGLVFLNSLIIAYFFGTELKMDIYFYAYNTVLIIATFISSLNSSVIIPESLRIRIQEGQKPAIRFLTSFFYGYLTLTILLSLFFFISPVSAFTALSKYEAGILKEQQGVLYLAIPLIMLISATTLLTDIMASYKFFTVPVVAAIVNAIFSLVFVLVFHNVLDVKSILAGLLLSYSLNIAMLLFLMKRYLHWDFAFRYIKLSRKVWSNIMYAQVGNLLTTFGGYAPLYFLSGAGTGVVAALNYAQQLVTQPTVFITNQFSAVSRIKFSELYVRSQYKELNKIFLSASKFLIFILAPVSGMLYLYPHEIITVLFKRGSFNETSVILSSNLLKFLGLSLPFAAVVSIAGGLYMAAQLIKASIIYQVISNVLLIALIYFLLRSFGYIGYPIAFFIINVINVLVISIYCVLYFPYIRYASLLRYLLLIISFNLLIVFLLSQIRQHLHPETPLLLVIFGGLIYVFFVIVLSVIFRLNSDFNEFLFKIRYRIARMIS